MKNLLFLFFFSFTSLFAAVHNTELTPTFLEKKIKIIDIRTLGEWHYTGIVKDSYTLTFFDEKGNYHIPSFMQALHKIINKNETFALLCRSGNRTTTVSNFLDKQGYKVINLIGGIKQAKRNGVVPVKYETFKRSY